MDANRLEELQIVAEITPVPLFITRENGEIVYANRALANLVGLTQEEMIGRVSPDFYVDPDDRGRFIEQLRRDGVVHDFETRVRSTTGREFWITQSAGRARLGGDEVLMGSVVDIDQRKKAEAALAEATKQLEQAHVQMIQQEKMAALGSLIAGLSHEINTPLGVVASGQQTLTAALRKLDATLTKTAPAAHGHKNVQAAFRVMTDVLDTVEGGAARLHEIMQRFASFTQLDRAERRLSDLHDGLNNTLLVVAHRLGKRIAVVKDYRLDAEVHCNIANLNQVFFTLLLRASEAIVGDGTITIRSWLQGDDAVITIEDDGHAMDPSQLSRVFEPALAVQGARVAMGMGLPIAYRITKEHGGDLRLDSNDGSGTTATVTVPLVPARSPTSRQTR
jgi:two-component system NtrC family sensor kinase